MKAIDVNWSKRNGHGQSVCHICHKLSWDSWLYDFNLNILEEDFFHTILCGDCINKIKNEMNNTNEIIEEEPKKIEKLVGGVLNEEDMSDTEKRIARRTNLLKDKINEIIDYINKIEKKLEE